MTAQSTLHFPNIHNYMSVAGTRFIHRCIAQKFPRFETLTTYGSELVGETDPPIHARIHAVTHSLMRTARNTLGAKTDIVR